MAEHPIHVSANEGASGVADDDAISIDHREDLEDDSLAEGIGHLILAQEEFDEAMDYPGCVRLSWMDAASDNHDFLPLLLGSRMAEVSDGDHGYFHSSKRRRQTRGLHELETVLIYRWVVVLLLLLLAFVLGNELILGFLDGLYKIRHHAEGVWERIGEEDLVIIVLKGVIPAQLVINTSSRLLLGRSLGDLADAVPQILATKAPSVAGMLRFFQAQDLHRHSLEIE